jgi:hypothetical protein
MIKRIRFAVRAEGMSAADFAGRWPEAVASAGQAPPSVRPNRVVACTVLPDLSGAQPKYDGVGFEWFADPPHLQRFTEWLATQPAESVADPGASPKLKHMAIAVRAAGLTPAEFSRRWRGHAGQLPLEISGLAYVQNHPRPRPHGEWACDALNEVWFDDLAGLRGRVEWFSRNAAGGNLFGQSWFLAAREVVLALSPRRWVRAEGHHGRPVRPVRSGA